MNIMLESFTTFYTSILSILSAFVPKLVAGILILLIGFIIASLLRDLVLLIYKYFRIGRWLESAGLAKDAEVVIWPHILSELIRWTTIFIFLMSSVEVWGIPKVADVLNQLLQFLPNVFVSVIIGWMGLVVARLVHDIIQNSVKSFGKNEALILANSARYSIIFFSILIILAQLGVAADLVRILFTGIVGMFALAFGLAFGFGGQDEAKLMLRKFIHRFEEPKASPKKSETVKSHIHPPAPVKKD